MPDLFFNNLRKVGVPEIHTAVSVYMGDRLIIAILVQTNQTAALYRETLATLTDVIRQSSFYDYLRDRETDSPGQAVPLRRFPSQAVPVPAAPLPIPGNLVSSTRINL